MSNRQQPSRWLKWLLFVSVVSLIPILTVIASANGSGILGFFELGPGVDADEGGLTNILSDGDPATPPDWADLFDSGGNVITSAVAEYDGLAAVFIPDEIALKGDT
ncbi:MAG: hypothetical protein KAT29_05950, partial [Anaerolineales bacterium]|nr:hypothetical protein [Anaerolineales bacterium]